MADAPKPQQGMIVRADFGGGIDESVDEWRTPPTQLAVLLNGRLDKPGSVRKRTGYFYSSNPAATNDPVAMLSAGQQLAFVNASKSTDGATATRESRRIARSFAYAATSTFVPTGPVSDVLADVTIFDGNTGNIDETFDVAATDDFVFIAKMTEATSNTLPTNSRFWVSQYDRKTGTLISELSYELLVAHNYIKLIRVPGRSTLIVAVAKEFTGPGNGAVNLFQFTFSGTGLVDNGIIGSTIGRSTVLHEIIYAFSESPDQKYRPLIPFDILAFDTGRFFVCAGRVAGSGVVLEEYAVSGLEVVTLTRAQNFSVGEAPVHELSICKVGSNQVGVAAIRLSPMAAPNWYAPLDAEFVRFGVLVSGAGLLLVGPVVSEFIARTNASCRVAPGRLTIGQTRLQGSNEPIVRVMWECMEYQEPYGVVRTMITRWDVGLTTGAGYGFRRTSAGTPAGRLFSYTDTAYESSTVLPQRLPVTVGASHQTFYGRSGSNLATNYEGNYSSNIGTLALVEPEDGTLSAIVSPVQTIAPRLVPAPPPNVVRIANETYVPHIVALDGSGGFGIGLVRLRDRISGDVQPSAFSALPILPGGVAQQIDGERVGEVTLADRPRIFQVTFSDASVAADFLAGDYLLQAVACYRDSAGNIHRSTPSDPYRLAMPGNKLTLRVQYAYQSYTTRADITLEFYITDQNGVVLRRWFDQANNRQEAGAYVDLYDSASASTTLAKGLPPLDAPTIYTTGGVLPYVPVPSCRFAFPFKNRLIVGGADDPKSIYYSNAAAAYQAPSFGAGNVIRMEHEAGCTAAGNVNDKLILFSEGAIYATFGQFRDNTGAGDALAELESLHDFLGCTQPQSVIGIPTGLIFFGTDDRFYMIDERLGLNPIGLRVENLTRPEKGSNIFAFNYVNAVVHIEKQREVRFYMTRAYGTEAAAPGLLVYNYQVDQWAQDTFTNLGASPAWGGACMAIDGIGCVVIHKNGLMNDTGTSYSDGNPDFTENWIPLYLETAWIQPGGTQDYARFRYAQILARSKTAHDLQVTVNVDFSAASVAQGVWTSAQLAPNGGVYPEQVRLQVGKQKTQAVKIKIVDQAPNGVAWTDGQGPEFIGLALEMLPLGGARRLPNDRKR